MGIYFGNLDRELADRQRVIQEDADRQYRGSRNTLKALSNLGNTISTEVKGYKEKQREDERTRYNRGRNTESDRIRGEQHSLYKLDSKIKNIQTLEARSVAAHKAKQWNYQDPELVTKHYERMRKEEGADLNLDTTERIMKYQGLYGEEAVKSVRKLLYLEKNDDGSDLDEQNILDARKKLTTYAPQGLKPWAIGQKLFNPLKGSVNPRAHTGRMFNAVLREAGYDIPDPENFKVDTSEDIMTTGYKVSGDKDKSSSVETKIGAVDLVDFGASEVNPEEKADASGSPDAATEKLWTENYNSTKVWDEVHGMWRDSKKAVIDANKKGTWNSDGEKVETVNASTLEDDPRLYKGEQGEPEYSDQDKLFIKNIKGVSANIPNLYGETTNETNSLSEDEVQAATNSGNPFTVGVQNALTERDKVKRPPSAMAYELEGSEAGRDPAFFPFMEGYKGRAVGSEYSKLPDYSAKGIPSKSIPGTPFATLPQDAIWKNVSPEERDAILTHPETTEFGASPKAVAGLIKAENELKEMNKKLLKVSTKANKFFKPDVYNPKEKWRIGERKQILNSLDNYMIPSLDSKISPGGGAMSAEAQAALGVATGKTAPPALLMELSRLRDKENELLNNLEYAESDVVNTRTKGVYNPKATRDWGKPSVLSDSAARIANAPKTITPSSLALKNSVQETVPTPQEVMGDLGQEVLVEGENLLETIRANEGRGVMGQGYAYFDGGDPDMESGNYKEKGGQHLTLSGGLNIYGSMKGSSADERNALADKIFIDNPKGKSEFLRYLNMEKSRHKDFYRTHKQRKQLMLSEEEQGRLTNYMLKDHLGKIQKHHPYLNKISEFPVAMQVFLVDTTFNMGPRWMKDKFKKFEGHLKKWATKGANPKEVRGMIKEFKDSDHYRKWGETNRLQKNIARLNSLDKAS
jgi:hypothetical protein